ncbi:response regulator [Nocardioides sp. TRM66260-LWL]|uniref:response regulator n=1 Tax=Nocardioides sp. TRM66260-LWL TaxID=2874478 RepID=UPI001CC7F9D4|nr:response regulator [Nocardioides sp. TRM66260-LWL]MBZ5734833.1 response regulator [Nocardioides sp. TRM66260-LWL]
MARILIADDDEDIRLLIVMRLRRDGHDLEAVTDGQAAWEALRAGGFDLAILDNSMPALTGLEVVERCRAEPGLAGLRILMVTALAQEQDVEGGLAAGADRYMTKPFGLGDLSREVGELVSRQADPA